MPNMEERSETRGGENQTVGYTNQNAGDEGQMHRGLLEPLEGETQISGTLVPLPGDPGLTFCGLTPKG